MKKNLQKIWAYANNFSSHSKTKPSYTDVCWNRIPKVEPVVRNESLKMENEGFNQNTGKYNIGIIN